MEFYSIKIRFNKKKKVEPPHCNFKTWLLIAFILFHVVALLITA